MGMWRRTVGRLGLDLGDGGPTLLDLRFADDILIFATTYIDASLLLDELVVCLSQVGLVLNTDKTKVMTTEAQPPSFLSTPAGLQIEILDQQSCHKWLGCMLSMPTVIKKRHDVDQHLQAASEAFFCHRATLCDRNVSLGKRLRYFDAVISPVAVFAAGHRTMYKTDLRKFDVLFRKLLRSVVGPPAGMDWTRPWHEILHDWNGRVDEFAALHSIKLWSERYRIQQHWDLAHYISSLEGQRWVKRLLQWQPDGRRRGGRPAHLWHTVLENICRWKGLQHWTMESRNHQSWMAMFPDFLHFVNL